MNEQLNKSQINPLLNPGLSAASHGQHPITAENKRSHCRQPHWCELTALHIYSGGLLNWHFAWCAAESISTHKSIKAHTSACDAEYKEVARRGRVKETLAAGERNGATEGQAGVSMLTMPPLHRTAALTRRHFCTGNVFHYIKVFRPKASGRLLRCSPHGVTDG